MKRECYNVVIPFQVRKRRERVCLLLLVRCYIPSVLPLLSFAMSTALELFQDLLKPHQTLVIPHELLGYEKNEFWFNSALPGESTGAHNHNGKAIISGVYYLQVPEKSGNVIFIHENKEKLEIAAEPGKLIFFPPELDHFVQENEGTEKRISLSFNCYLFPLTIPKP